jgi:hypothetical protein
MSMCFLESSDRPIQVHATHLQSCVIKFQDCMLSDSKHGLHLLWFQQHR